MELAWHLPQEEWTLIRWPPGSLIQKIWVCRVDHIESIARTNDASGEAPGTILRQYQGLIALEGDNHGGILTYEDNVVVITPEIWQWLTRDEGGPGTRGEGYDYLSRLWRGESYESLIEMFENDEGTASTTGNASDGEGKEPVELYNIHIKF